MSDKDTTIGTWVKKQPTFAIAVLVGLQLLPVLIVALMPLLVAIAYAVVIVLAVRGLAAYLKHRREHW